MKPGKTYLSIECFLLYGLIPGLLFWFQMHGGVKFFPVLFGFLGITLLLAWRDPTVKFVQRPPLPLPRFACRQMGLRLGAAAVGLFLICGLFYPRLLLRLPRERPQLWLLIMCLYPLLSVAPQEFMFRSFFMQRYRPLFGNRTVMCAVNALAFAWAHAFFLNWIAPLLSLLAGWLLARTWQNTARFRWVCLEHAVYGQIVFTCGLGWFFYHGSTQALQGLTP